MSADVQVLSDVLLAAALCFWIFCFVNTSRLGARRMPGMINMTVVKAWPLSFTCTHLPFPATSHTNAHSHMHADARVDTHSVYSWYQKYMASVSVAEWW